MTLAERFESIRPRYPEFAGKVALVTGSAKGIGREIALRLGKEGMSLVLHGHMQAQVDETLHIFQSLGIDAIGVCTDFGKPDGVEQLFDAIRQRHTTLDLLVNNAADLRRTNFDKATIDLYDYQMAVNTRAPYQCSLLAVPMMRPTKSGAIVNISSVGGLRAHWKALPYDVTKGAIDAMTKAMSLDLALEGIRVNAIAPGAIYTEKTDRIPPERIDTIRERIPLQRFGTGLDLGAMVAFLASEDASYITGQVIYVDGGITTQLSPSQDPL